MGLPVVDGAREPVPERPAVPSRAWAGCITLATCALYAWFIARGSFDVDGRRAFSLFDDAMISMRYASNLAHGDGLVFNAGDPAVEGYTNLLWTLWMAAVHLLPTPARLASLWVSLSSAALLLGNLLLVRRLAARAGASAPFGLFATLFCAVCYPLVFWSLRGLEVGCLAFLVDAAVLLAWRVADGDGRSTSWGLAIVLAAMILVRDDGLAVAGAIILFLASDPRTRGASLRSTAVLAGTIAAHTAFRLAYYGAPLPNTYYLKLSRIPLEARLLRGLAATIRTFVCELWLPTALTIAAITARPLDKRRLMLGVIVLAQAVATIGVGGDAWESWGQPDRFLAVVLPALIIAAALGVQDVANDPPGRGAKIFLVAALGWRACGLAAGDFVPTSFTVTPPIDLHRGLPGLRDAWSWLVLVALAGSALAWTARRSRTTGTRPSIVWMGALVIAATVGGNWRDLLRGERTGSQIQWDNYTAAFGIRMGEALPQDATVAVVAAGAVPYFSRLRAVDLLGKSDPHVAREAPVERFIPGHDKRDYAYSLRTYAPDFILDLWHHTPEELEAVAALGYLRLANGMYVRGSCPAALSERIAALPPYRFVVRRPK